MKALLIFVLTCSGATAQQIDYEGLFEQHAADVTQELGDSSGTATLKLPGHILITRTTKPGGGYSFVGMDFSEEGAVG